MSRIPTPATNEEAPVGSRALLADVQRTLGSTPNMFRLISNSPATLEGYLGLSGALSKGLLNPATRERIALAIANYNGCDYCNSAHSYLGKNLAKLDEAEMTANREGWSTDAKADAAVRFAMNVARNRGQVTADDLSQVRAAGYADAELLEIVGHVALNVLTNYVNEAFETQIDFPMLEAARAA